MKFKICITGIIVTALLTIPFAYTHEIHAIQKNNSKVLEVMHLIKKDAVEKYLKDIISFGPRVTGTASCRETAEYIYEKFSEMGLVTKYQNWTAYTGFKNLTLPF